MIKGCPHKFINDLQLQYVYWPVETLFIGTFNPSWKTCSNNYADWFYGRTKHNEFWCILPKIHSQPSLLDSSKDDWLNFCSRNRIAITDIIESIMDVDVSIEAHRRIVCGFKDIELEQFEPTINDIPAILEKYTSIKQICVTRQEPISVYWRNCFHKLNEYISENPDRKIELKFLRSPSRGARKGVKGKFCDFLVNRWREQGYSAKT